MAKSTTKRIEPHGNVGLSGCTQTLLNFAADLQLRPPCYPANPEECSVKRLPIKTPLGNLIDDNRDWRAACRFVDSRSG